MQLAAQLHGIHFQDVRVLHHEMVDYSAESEGRSMQC